MIDDTIMPIGRPEASLILTDEQRQQLDSLLTHRHIYEPGWTTLC